jgi:hypothetical protein
MSDRFVTIAAFDSPIEANLVLGLLEGECVRAMLGGEEATSVFAGLGIAEITLQVHETDVARADEILDEYQQDADEPGLADQEAPTGWVCSLCGDLAAEDATVCPSCQTPRSAVRDDAAPELSRFGRRSGMTRRKAPEGAVQRLGETTASVPMPTFPAGVGDETELRDLPDLTLPRGDDMARRAGLAAVFALLTLTSGFIYLFMGLVAMLPFFAYSCWTLLKLMTYSGELSPAGMRWLYTAVILNGITVLSVLSLLSFWWSYQRL